MSAEAAAAGDDVAPRQATYPWEIIHQGPEEHDSDCWADDAVHLLAVPGGWLYRVGLAVAFVPDPDRKL